MEQVYCLRDMVEELHMEHPNNTNLALLFEVKEKFNKLISFFADDEVTSWSLPS